MAGLGRGGPRSQKDSIKADAEHLDYLLTPLELFARAYTQYVAFRSGDDDLLDGIDHGPDAAAGAIRRSRRAAASTRTATRSTARRYSPRPTAIGSGRYADFLPLIHKFDTLFEQRGWLTRNRL